MYCILTISGVAAYFERYKGVCSFAKYTEVSGNRNNAADALLVLKY